MQYKYSISVNDMAFASTEEMFKKLHDCGYRAIDTSGADYKDSAIEEKNYCDNFKRLAKIYDIELYQSHFPIVINKPESEYLGDEYKARVLKRVERVARLGIRNVAIHGYVPEGLDFFRNATPYDYTKLEAHNRELNLEFFSWLKPYLKKEGITACIENLFAYDMLMQRHVLSTCGNADETNYYIDNLGDDCFAACYDSGHLNLFGADEYEYITKLGKRLRIVHFQESWGKNFKGMDWHLLPGDGDVNWEAVKKGLTDVGYTGTINAELNPRKGKLFDLQLKYIADAFKALLDD